MKQVVNFFLILFLFVFIPFYAFPAGKKAIVGCHIVNPTGAPSLENAVIIIQDGKIIYVGKVGEVELPNDVEIIDASGKWVIPGLIDSHIHFFQSGGIYTRPDILNLTKYVPYEDELQKIKDELPRTFARYLRNGITSVVDMGGPFWNFEIRKQAEETLLAPRVAVAGPLISTYNPEALQSDDSPIIKVNSIDEAKALVKKQVEHNTDFIKIWYIVRSGQSPADNFELVKATAEEAHKYKKPVIIHATSLETAKAAIRAGADILAHSIYDQEVDDEFIQLCKKNKIIYSTTVIVTEGYLEALSGKVHLSPAEYALSDPYIASSLFDLKKLPKDAAPARSNEWIQKRKSRIAFAQKNIKKLQDAGIIIAANTDAGNIGTLPGPSIFREFDLLAEAGLTPRQIITAATLNNAKLMQRENELGSVEKGKLADLLILNTNPLLDILNTSDIYKVVKNGHVFSPEEIIPSSPEDIVQQQVNAYNGLDINAFMATYHSEIKIYNHPNTIIYDSPEKMRERYKALFENNPEQHCEIVERITIGNFVIDKEKVTGRANGKVVNAVAVYEVKDGLIYRVWFIK